MLLFISTCDFAYSLFSSKNHEVGGAFNQPLSWMMPSKGAYSHETLELVNSPS